MENIETKVMETINETTKNVQVSDEVIGWAVLGVTAFIGGVLGWKAKKAFDENHEAKGTKPEETKEGLLAKFKNKINFKKNKNESVDKPEEVDNKEVEA